MGKDEKLLKAAEKAAKSAYINEEFVFTCPNCGRFATGRKAFDGSIHARCMSRMCNISTIQAGRRP